MKSRILTLLREKQDYVSGQYLCDHFGVSRTAVWKAIGQLKKEGYQIEAVQNKGYLLREGYETSPYGRNEILSLLETKWAGRELVFLDKTDSTNLQAKLLGEKGTPHGTLVVADMQTAGRGRRGRDWESPAGSNIYFSLVLRPDLEPNKASMLTLVMAMAVRAAIDHEKAMIKWPNDIVMDGKKVCGILTEMSLSVEYDSIQYVVIGVGVNVKKQSFPEAIQATATTLEEALAEDQEACQKNLNRGALVCRVMHYFEHYYQCFLEQGSLEKLIPIYEKSLVNKDQQVKVLDPKGEFEGIARGINAQGELIVEAADGKRYPVYAGEVSVRGIYGYV